MIALRRRPNWRSALINEIETHRRAPFVWGKRDCGIFVADCIKVMTGHDFASGFRGRYKSEASAERVLRDVGHDSIVSFAAAHLPEIVPSQARMGDVAAIEGTRGWSLGIFNGGVVLVLAEGGIGTVAFPQAQRAFRV